jgi:nicotinate-nucleotide--dimethylbenzimidazole phosphoribosyltransferase
MTSIKQANEDLQKSVQHKIDFKTKPIGALGRLEELALQICVIQKTESPKLNSPHILIFAADHGIANEGVSAYPQDVTWQMVYNFLNGGAAISVFARQHGICVKVIDAGVNRDFESLTGLISAKIGYGTKSFLHEMAMSKTQLFECKKQAKRIVTDVIEKTRSNVIGFGEMGIGNTSSASLIMHCLTGFNLSECIGKGTGLNDEQISKKYAILNTALQNNKPSTPSPYNVLQTFGGFEIAMITEAMLESFESNCIILVDGFIATAAFLVAYKINPAIIKNSVFCHQSEEKGHQLLLNYLHVKPLVNLNMRLGEGTGCAIAYPIIQSAVDFINEMASFETAGVSNKDK